MRILAVDTSAVCASVAVTENGKVLSESSVNTGLTHSRTLLPMIDSTLKNAEIELNDIDFFCCAFRFGLLFLFHLQIHWLFPLKILFV